MMQLHLDVSSMEERAINYSLADAALGARRESLSKRFRRLRDRTRRER
jgi:hypothetical protein